MTDKQCRLSCEQALDDGENIWFSLLRENGLCKLEKSTGKIEYVLRFPTDAEAERLYKAMAKVGDILVIAPWNASADIVIYNCRTKQLVTVKLKENWSALKFCNCIAYKRKVFIIGCYYPGIVCLDLDTFEIKYIDDWVDEIEKVRDLTAPYLTEGIAENHKLICPFCGINALLETDMDTMHTRIIWLSTQLLGFNGMIKVGKEYWLMAWNAGMVLVLDEKYQNQEEISILDGQGRQIEQKVAFHRPVLARDKVMLFPANEFHVYEIDPITKKVIISKGFEEILAKRKKRDPRIADLTFVIQYSEKNIVIVFPYDDSWHLYDYKTNLIKSFEIKADRNINMILLKNKYRKVLEERRFSLNEYIKLIESLYDTEEFATGIVDEKFGKKIHENTIKSLSNI